ncbi:MAG: hypothetical protein J6K55_06980 [Clostridia bacterium]|nr:hypothetical protein [Clostridia bacterium]
MDKIILMVDTGRNVSLSAAQWLTRNGCRVVMLQKQPRPVPGAETVLLDLLDHEAVKAFAETFSHLDILVLGAPPCPEDGPIGTGHDLEQMLQELVYLGRGTENLVQAFLPKLRMGMKRIACLTEPEGTHSMGCESQNLLRHQMLAALNMLGKQWFNLLRPEGFTFRWFLEGDVPGPLNAGEYLLMPLSYHPEEVRIHNEEDRLVIRDGALREIPW